MDDNSRATIQVANTVPYDPDWPHVASFLETPPSQVQVHYTLRSDADYSDLRIDTTNTSLIVTRKPSASGQSSAATGGMYPSFSKTAFHLADDDCITAIKYPFTKRGSFEVNEATFGPSRSDASGGRLIRSCISLPGPVRETLGSWEDNAHVRDGSRGYFLNDLMLMDLQCATPVRDFHNEQPGNTNGTKYVVSVPRTRWTFGRRGEGSATAPSCYADAGMEDGSGNEDNDNGEDGQQDVQGDGGTADVSHPKDFDYGFDARLIGLGSGAWP